MADYEPRPLSIQSETITSTYFLTGFISFPDKSSDSVGAATFYPQGDDKDQTPLLQFAEELNGDGALNVQALPPYTFLNGLPSTDFNVEYGSHKKIKTSHSTTHAAPVVPPELYVPRLFWLQDDVDSDNGSPANIYGFLIDTYPNDQIVPADGDNLRIIPNSEGEYITQIYLFPITLGVQQTVELYIGEGTDDEKTIDFGRLGAGFPWLPEQEQ